MTPERWERIQELYHAARARADSNRPGFLTDACGDDEALRREVQALLDQPISTGGFVDFLGGPVPAHLRNAPTRLMKELGYGAEYRYAHDYPGHFVKQDYLPEPLADRELYAPGDLGYDKKVAERMAWWKSRSEE